MMLTFGAGLGTVTALTAPLAFGVDDAVTALWLLAVPVELALLLSHPMRQHVSR